MFNNNIVPNMNIMNNNNIFMPNIMMSNNNFIPNMNNNNFLPNINNNIFMPNMNNNNFHQSFNGRNKNIIFETAQGKGYHFLIKYGTTIDQILEIFFRNIGRPDLYDKKDNDIVFLHNACRLRYGDQTKIEEFFQYSENPVILVNDLNNIKG